MYGKTVSIIAVCLVFALAGSSGWFYLRTNDLEGRMGDLERTNEELADELSELSKPSTTDLEIIGLPTWITSYGDYCPKVRLVVKNNGISILSIVGILVNGTFVGITPSIVLNPNAETTINITHPTGSFISGAKYEFVACTLVVASSSKHIYEATFFAGAIELVITNVAFTGASGVANNTIVLTVKNTGTTQVTVDAVKVNSLTKTAFSGDLTLAAGDTGKTITVYMGSGSWTNGNAYQIELYDSSGQAVGSTQKNAP